MQKKLDAPQYGPKEGVEEIRDSSGTLLAMIIRSAFKKPGINFVTPGDFSQQVGCLLHPVGKKIEPHVHNLVVRQVQFTQEVLFIRKGKVRVDFYEETQAYLVSSILASGDTILLICGGHGFEVLEEADIIEVKQGPYVGDHDKTRFKSIEATKLRWQDK